MVTISAAAVLLDMDGTLVDSRAATEKVWTAWSLRHDLAPEQTLSIIHGRQGHESMAILLPDRPHAENLAENQILLAEETAELGGVVALAGAADLLAALEHAPHALVTSASIELATARMGAAGLRMPEIIVSAADVTASKPHPEGFLAAAALLQVEPGECVVFEDSVAGISAGFAAGMRVVGVGPHASEGEPTWVVETPAQVSVEAGDDGIRLTL